MTPLNQSLHLEGTSIDGKYLVVSMIGRGGMGTVYSAVQSDLNRKVVIKFLNLDFLNDPDKLARFEQEGKMLASLQHKNLVKLYSIGIYAERIPYLVMEAIDGQSLADELKILSKLSWQRSLDIAKQACLAMTYAHEKGILHRDLKPDNIMLASTPQADSVKIIDFGLARLIERSGQITLTETGALLGSPLYMSPEVCSGLRPDQRSDVYSLACVLYECLAGHPPFVDDNAVALLYKHKNELPQNLIHEIGDSSCPPHLDAVILKALEKLPEQRFQSMQEFASAIDTVINRRTVSFNVDDVSALRKGASSGKRKESNRWLAFIALSLIVIATIFFAAVNIGIRKNSENQSRGNITNQSLEQVESLLTQALAADKRKDRKKAEYFSKSALRVMSKELTSQRQNKLYLEREVSLIDKFTALSPYLVNNSTEPDARQENLTDIEKIQESEWESKHFLNHAEILMLEANILAKSPNNFVSITSYCEAAQSFAKIGESKLSSKCIALAERLLGPSGDTRDYFVRRLEIARASLFLAQKDFLSFEKMIEHATKEYPTLMAAHSKSHLELVAGKLYEEADKLDLAAKHFEATMLVAQQGDGDRKQALEGLASIAIKKGDKRAALQSYERLKAELELDNDISATMNCEAEIARLKSELDK